ncbi:MAG: 23S rRNA (uridine(2552)-2'-O)-methyltransferase RlmE [Sinobacteraceae bacterium]|nr:23S rRNA (uridine(2552)-2'-O)-methyltransferase RlmE [Nevskiaceae bacterium]
MARSKSSGQWLHEHVTDPYVRQAQKDGYRSRASYKLLQLNERDRLLRPGMLVIDLGSAPGGWSQVASRLLGERGHVLATDILPMEPIPQVEFMQGDFTSDAMLEALLAALGNRQPDVVLSDIAPNISGIDSADQASSIYLVELALEFARKVLKPGGDLVVKVFQGAGSDDFLKELRTSFGKVLVRKPAASRPRSREVYAVARAFRPS